jgi:hypothetical protein
MYHVMNRGDHLEVSFRDGKDPALFLATLAEACGKVLVEELARRGWGTEQLAQLRKADAEKLRIAKRLRAETTMTLDWIAQRLQAGAPGYLANCLRQEGQ